MREREREESRACRHRSYIKTLLPVWCTVSRISQYRVCREGRPESRSQQWIGCENEERVGRDT